MRDSAVRSAFVRSAVERVRERLVELEFRERLVEVELRRRLGLGRINLGRLVEEEVTLRWPTGGRDWRGPVGQIEVNEDGAEDRRIGEEGEDPHLATTVRAQQGEHLVNPSEKLRPAAPSGSGCGRGGPVDAGLRGLRGRDVLIGNWVIAGLTFAQGDHVGPKAGVRRKDAVVSMTMDAWRRDEARQALEQFEGREDEDGPAVGRGSG